MRDVRQDSAEYVRRWFFDENFDLIVWYARGGELRGFQLCYDKTKREKALTWFSDRGVTHHWVDGGEQTPTRNRSPMLVEVEGRAEMPGLLSSFEASKDGLPPELQDAVKQKINEYGRDKILRRT